MRRRKFIGKLGKGTITAFLPTTLLSFTPTVPMEDNSKDLNFGIIADVHKDLMPDANKRLETFINEANERDVDFIIQMGDFCMAENKNKDFMEIWETYKGPKYHVLGNHDMDKQSKQEMLDFWGMPKTYYSYDFQGFHFIVLDANFLYQDGKFIDYNKANFYVDDSLRTYINNEQIEWFNADLKAAILPTIIFSHQSLWHYQWGVKNKLMLQKIMEEQAEKIVCCLNGHNHIDYHHRQNGINYVDINSMSYQWMSDKYKSNERFPKEFYESYKWLPNIASYKDPLYAFVKLNPKGTMSIEGIRSQWMPPSPYDMGMDVGIKGSVYSAEISDYQLKFD